ncbi:hypothetical protein D3C72_1541020 [compost metagenome]
MGARAEGQARVEAHDGGIGGLRGLRQLMVPRHDPGAAAEVHRLELVQPRALPVFVFHGAEAAVAPVQLRVEGFQRGQQQQGVAVGREQRAEHQGVPQRGLAHAGLQDGLLVAGIGFGIQQGHRQRADVLQRILIAGLGGFGATQGQFQERHGGEGNRGKGGHARPSGRLRMP